MNESTVISLGNNFIITDNPFSCLTFHQVYQKHSYEVLILIFIDMRLIFIQKKHYCFFRFDVTK